VTKNFNLLVVSGRMLSRQSSSLNETDTLPWNRDSSLDIT